MNEPNTPTSDRHPTPLEPLEPIEPLATLTLTATAFKEREFGRVSHWEGPPHSGRVAARIRLGPLYFTWEAFDPSGQKIGDGGIFRGGADDRRDARLLAEAEKAAADALRAFCAKV